MPQRINTCDVISGVKENEALLDCIDGKIYNDGKVKNDEPSHLTDVSSFRLLLQPEHPYCTACSPPPPLAQQEEDNHDVALKARYRLKNHMRVESSSCNEPSGISGQFVKEEKEVIVRSRLIVRSGLCCYSEVPVIKKLIFSLPSIKCVQVNVTTKMVYVDHQIGVTTASSIVDLLNSQGFSTNILSDVVTDEKDKVNDTMKENGDDLIMPLHWNIIFSGVFWIISLLSINGGPWQYCKYAGVISMFFGLPSAVKKAWKTLARWQFDANCMMVIAAVSAAMLGEYDEAASVSFLFSISEYLENLATVRARKALSTIVKLNPDRANLIVTAPCDDSCQHSKIVQGDKLKMRESSDDVKRISRVSLKATSYLNHHFINVPASSLKVNSFVVVRTGDRVPTDGTVVEGKSTVDESLLTGEARPVCKIPGDSIVGGSINIGASPLVMKTKSTVQDSAMSRLVRLVEESQVNRSPTEKLVDKFARIYTPTVLLFAMIICIVPWVVAGPDVGRKWALNGLTLIVLACPCAWTISTPVTYAAGLAATAQNGIIIKGGSALEALGRVDKIVFDKTGTLTRGKFVMASLTVISGKYSRAQVLQLLALMESSSSHPLASALVNAAVEEGTKIPSNIYVNNHTTLHGEGVKASLTFDGNSVPVKCYVGNQRLMERIGMWSSLPQHVLNEVENWSSSGGTIGFLGLDNDGIVAAFCVRDSVRPEAKQVVAELRDRYKFSITILTGDSPEVAHALADQVGLSDKEGQVVKAQLLPEDKLRTVKYMIRDSEKIQPAWICRSRGLLLFCGDGINDAPSMSAADVSVAMGNGAALALEASDIGLMDSNLNKLTYSIDMGRRVLRTIQENILFSFMAKLAIVVLALAGKTTLLMAISTDVSVMLIVTLNGMKLLPGQNDFIIKHWEPRKTSSGLYGSESKRWFTFPVYPLLYFLKCGGC